MGIRRRGAADLREPVGGPDGGALLQGRIVAFGYTGFFVGHTGGFFGALATTYVYEGGRVASTIEQVCRDDGPCEPPLFAERAYDAAGRLVREEVRAGDGTLVEVRTYAYDAAGRLVRRETADEIETWTYDDAGRLVEHATVPGRVETWTWDAEGRLIGYRGFADSAWDEAGNLLLEPGVAWSYDGDCRCEQADTSEYEDYSVTERLYPADWPFDVPAAPCAGTDEPEGRREPRPHLDEAAPFPAHPPLP